MLDKNWSTAGAHADLEAALARSARVEDLLCGYCRNSRYRLVVGDEVQPPVSMLAPEVLLPVIAFHAEATMLEMLLSAAQKAGRPTAALPRFPLGCVIERDDSASLGVYVNVPRMTNDGWGAMRATMFLSAFHKVFGLPNADGSHKHVHCEGLFLMYGPSGEESISRMVGSRQERANGFADAADGSVDYMQLMT